MGTLPLKKGNAEYISSTVIDWLNKNNVHCAKLVGMDLDGAATVGGKKSLDSTMTGEQSTTCYLHPLA